MAPSSRVVDGQRHHAQRLQPGAFGDRAEPGMDLGSVGSGRDVIDHDHPLPADRLGQQIVIGHRQGVGQLRPQPFGLAPIPVTDRRRLQMRPVAGVKPYRAAVPDVENQVVDEFSSDFFDAFFAVQHGGGNRQQKLLLPRGPALGGTVLGDVLDDGPDTHHRVEVGIGLGVGGFGSCRRRRPPRRCPPAPTPTTSRFPAPASAGLRAPAAHREVGRPPPARLPCPRRQQLVLGACHRPAGGQHVLSPAR